MHRITSLALLLLVSLNFRTYFVIIKTVLSLLEAIFIFSWSLYSPSAPAICHDEISLCAAKQRSILPAKSDATAHTAEYVF